MVEDANASNLREELAQAKKNLEEQAAAAKKAILKKEAEIAKRVAKEIAEKEKNWAEREENMKALLRQRQARGGGGRGGGGGGRGGRGSGKGKGGKGRGGGGKGGSGRGSGGGGGGGEDLLDFGEDGDEDFQLVNVKRRVVTSLMQGSGYGGESNDDQPYLTLLSRDPAISRSVRIGVGGDGEKLRIGRPGAPIPQDLEVDGVGMASETCIMWSSVDDPNREPGVAFYVCAASPDAIV
jgi:hypothetical protein